MMHAKPDLRVVLKWMIADKTTGQTESYSAVFDRTRIATSPMQSRANSKLASSHRNDHNGRHAMSAKRGEI